LQFVKSNISLFLIWSLLIIAPSHLIGQGLPIPIGVPGGIGVGVPDIPTNTLSEYPLPYANKAADYRSVYLLRAIEMGEQKGIETAIRSIFFEVEKAQQAPLFNFTIRMRQTMDDSLSIPITDAGLEVVYGPLTYVEKKGFNEHRFDVPFCWDGVSNIIVDICVQNGADDNSLNAIVVGSVPDTTKNSSYHDWRDDGMAMCDAADAMQPELFAARPKMYWSFIGGNEVDLRKISAPLPGSFMKVNTTQIIDFTFQNYGCEPVTNPILAYKWNDGAEVSEQWSGTIEPGQEVNYTFQQPITADNQGFNSLKIWTDDPTDVFRANDTLSKLVWVKDTSSAGLDYTGTEFWIAFMKNYDNGPSLKQRLFITSGNNTPVTVSFPLLGWNTTVNVIENEVVEVVIPNEVAGAITATDSSEVITRNGLLIQSEKSISVYGYSGVTYTTDAFLAIPSRTIGTEYVVMAPAGIYNATGLIVNTPLINAPAEFIVVATKDNTEVTIIPSAQTEKSNVGDTISVTLQMGETYLVQAAIENLAGISTGTFDLSGSTVTANKQVAVISGSQCAMMPSIMDPNKCDACDHLLEQMTPTDTWGKTFYLTDFDYKPGNDIVRIMSSSDTSVNLLINGSIAVTLPPKGGYYDYTFNGNLKLQADAPVQVGQFCTGANCEPTSLTDPFYTNIIPTEQWGNFYTFSTPVINGFDIHYVNIIKKGGNAKVSLNSTLINQNEFTAVAGTDFFAGKIRVPKGSHIITADSIIAVYVYGFGRAESYGYPSSGSLLKRLNVELVDVVIDETPPSCFKTNDGVLTADVLNGSAPFQYLWSTGDTTKSLQNIGEGTYWVKVTDLYGYFSHDTVTVNYPEALETQMGGSNVSCFEGDDGAAWVNISGGTKPYTIEWLTTPPSLNDTLLNLTAGEYKVKVVDYNGCEKIDSVNITQPSRISVYLDINNLACFEDNNASVGVNALGGIGQLSINWPSENLTQIWNRSGMSAGEYYFEITDNNGCKTDSLFTITQPTKFGYTITNLAHDKCEQGIGALSLESYGGVMPHQLTWRDGGNDWSRNNLEANSYVFEIVDDNLCSITDTIEITTTQVPKLSLVNSNMAKCENGTGSAEVNVLGGDEANYLIKWNTAPPTYGSSVIELNSGLYVVKVNDLTCSDSLTVFIDFVPPPEITFNKISPTCGVENGSIEAVIVSGTAPFQFSWNTTPIINTNPLTNIEAGSYKLTLTDSICVIEQQVDLLSIDGPQATITTTNSNCALDNGMAQVFASGGSGAYTYSWDGAPPSANSNATNLTTGTHQILIDDGICQLLLAFEIEATKKPNIYIDDFQNAICGTPSGEVIVNAIHGSGTYNFTWSDTLLTNRQRKGLLPSQFMAYVNDGFCSDSVVVNINDYRSIQSNLISCKNATCGQDASAYVTAIGGTGNYIWSWSFDSLLNINTVTDIPPGSHYAKVIDGTCIDSTLVEILDIKNLTAWLIKTADAQCDLPTGNARSGANGGSGNYTYSWIGVDSNNTAIYNNMYPGFYTLNVIDGTCLWSDTITINNEEGPKLAIEDIIPQRCGEVNGRAEVKITQGSGTVWWDIAPKEYRSYIKNKTAGDFTAFVADGVCIDSLTLSIPYYAGPEITVIPSGASCDDFNGSAVVRTTGGLEPISFIWHTFPVSFDSIASNLEAGNYYVEVIDSFCTTFQTFNIADLGSPTINTISKSHAYCGLENGVATVAAYGGSGAYSFTWETTPVQNGIMATDLAPGIYKAIVSDGFCTDDLLIEIEDKPKPIRDTEEIVPAHCAEENGEIKAIPYDEAYTVKWLTADSIDTWTINNLSAGTYKYVIYNKWCTDTFNIKVDLYDLAELNYNIISEKCYKSNGSIIITEKTPYNGISNIIWETGAVEYSRNDLSAGDYRFVWSDEYCEIIDTISIVNIEGAKVFIDSIQHPVCDWDDGYIYAHYEGGQPPVVGKWLDGNLVTNSRVGLDPNDYVFRVTDLYCKTDTIIRLVDKTPVFTVDQRNEYCENENGSITVKEVKGIAPFVINWSADSTKSYARTGLAAGEYPFNITDSRGCAVFDTTRLNEQFESPSHRYILQNPLHIFEGDPVYLSGEYPLKWNFLKCITPEGDTIFEWPLKYQSLEAGSLPFNIIYQSDNGCVDTLKFYLFVDDDGKVYIPNAFTPDESDDLNSVFKIYGTGIANIEGGVFDRWGELIKSFSSLDDFWDGTFKGKKCMSAVYSYRFFITDTNRNLTKAFGTVTLLR
jgi:gliding motility-associated-like protein